VRVCSDPDGDVGELADILARDPILAGQVLRVANSAFYYRGAEVTSLHRAAMVLGMRALKVVALGFTLSNDLPQSGVAAGLDLRVYWHRSVLNAVIARSLARSVDQPIAEEAFLCGLLSDIGKLVLTQAVPDEYAPLVEESGGWPPDGLERERLGFVASEAAERLLRAWKLPEVLVLGSAFASRPAELPAEAPEEAGRIAGVVGLAQLGAAILFADDASGPIVRFAEEAERRFGLSSDDVEALIAGLEEECGEAASMLSLELPSGVSYQALLEQARNLMVSMSVDAMLRLDETSRTIAVLEREKEELAERTRTDELTGLPNRAMLDWFLAQQVQARLREDLPDCLGLIVLGVDRLARFTDMLGNKGGDEALKAVAATLKETARESEMLCRFGREEFCVAVPHGTLETLAEAGERLRAAIAAHDVDLGAMGTWPVTGSLGCAVLPEVVVASDAAALCEAAEAQLYRARKAGGNCVAVASEPIVVH
jgi:diguanylate cyclase (GGDEF)-like protein